MTTDNESSWLDDKQDEDLSDASVETVIFRRFTIESEAQLISAYLNRHNIPNFLSNTFMNQMLPMGHGGISLHIRSSDVSKAEDVMDDLDDTTIHDLELDIEKGEVTVKKSGSSGHNKLSIWYLAIIMIIVLLLIFHAIFSSEDSFKIW